jgi:uncharacterized membrane protein YphA (DoxX/SURF4 family)
LIEAGETGPAVFHLAGAAWLVWLVGFLLCPWWTQLGLSDALLPLVVAGLAWFGLWWVVRYLPGRLLVLTSRVILGFFCIGMAWGRIIDPQHFARVLIDYDLLPYQLINLTALGLPWFEIIVGLGLIVGLRARVMAAVAGLLTLGFMVASPLGSWQGFSSAWEIICQDAWRLILAGHVFWFEDGRWAVDRWLSPS